MVAEDKESEKTKKLAEEFMKQAKEIRRRSTRPT